MAECGATEDEHEVIVSVRLLRRLLGTFHVEP